MQLALTLVHSRVTAGGAMGQGGKTFEGALTVAMADAIDATAGDSSALLPP